jgi:hypothetical protein
MLVVVVPLAVLLADGSALERTLAQGLTNHHQNLIDH